MAPHTVPCKMTIIGSPRAGKTRFRQFACGTSRPGYAKRYQSTHGIDYEMLAETNESIQLWECGGAFAEQQPDVTKAVYRGSMAILFMTQDSDYEHDGSLKNNSAEQLSDIKDRALEAKVIFLYPSDAVKANNNGGVESSARQLGLDIETQVFEQPDSNTDQYVERARVLKSRLFELAQLHREKQEAIQNEEAQRAVPQEQNPKFTDGRAVTLIDNFERISGFSLSEAQKIYLQRKLTEDNSNAWTKPEIKKNKQRALKDALEKGHIVDLYNAANEHTGYGLLTSTGANDSHFPLDGLYFGRSSKDKIITTALEKLELLQSQIHSPNGTYGFSDVESQYLAHKMLPMADQLADENRTTFTWVETDGEKRKKAGMIGNALLSLVNENAVVREEGVKQLKEAIAYHTSVFHWSSTAGETVFTQWFERQQQSPALQAAGADERRNEIK